MLVYDSHIEMPGVLFYYLITSELEFYYLITSESTYILMSVCHFLLSYLI